MAIDKVKKTLIDLRSIDNKFTDQKYVYEFAECLAELIPQKTSGSEFVFLAQELSSQLFYGLLFPPKNYDLLGKLDKGEREVIDSSIPIIVQYLPRKVRKEAENYLARQNERIKNINP